MEKHNPKPKRGASCLKVKARDLTVVGRSSGKTEAPPNLVKPPEPKKSPNPHIPKLKNTAEIGIVFPLKLLK